MFVVMYGSLGEGYTSVGPFKTLESAKEYASDSKDAQIMELSLPAGVSENGEIPVLIITIAGGCVTDVETDTPSLASMIDVIVRDGDSGEEGVMELLRSYMRKTDISQLKESAGL